VSVERYHDWVAEQGCLVCSAAATLHHVTGYADKPGRFSRDNGWWFRFARRTTRKCFDPLASDPISVEGLGHQGFFEKYGIDLLSAAMQFADSYRVAA
jgi:hypothetical protein